MSVLIRLLCCKDIAIRLIEEVINTHIGVKTMHNMRMQPAFLQRRREIKLFAH